MKQIRSLAALLLALTLLLGTACAEGELRGYVKGEGYVYVALGEYMQTIDGGVPEEDKNTWIWSKNVIADTTGMTFEKTPIVWRVLTVDEEKAYLCSEYVLFAMPMHRNYIEYKTLGKDFGQTELCAYLNGEFAETAFTQAEMDMLLPCETYGKVFLLDKKDVQSRDIGMGKGNGMKAWATEYAIRVTGAFVYMVGRGAHSPYWVRNQAEADARHARCTKSTGYLGHIVSDRENEGVRPAVYLAMDAFTITGGTGTKLDPYTLAPKAGE